MPADEPITYHLVPVAYWEAQPTEQDYQPEYFDQEGFIHCTDGLDNLVATANRHYRDDPRPFYVLDLRRDAIRPELRYEDAKGIYPHIYGRLNRDAVVRVRPMPRAADGAFTAPA